MKIPNLLTGLLTAAAAFKGAQGAPATTTQSGVFEIKDICNGALPDSVFADLNGNYVGCLGRAEENPRLFGSWSPTALQALCVAQAGMDTGFRHALKAAPSEVPVVRFSLRALIESRPADPFPPPAVAGHSPEALLQINFHDYKHSGSTSYLRQLKEQVDLLRRHIAPADRTSPEAAAAAALLPDCRRAWKRHLTQWVRTEISERTTLVTMRQIGNPESISPTQAKALQTELAQMRFGLTPMKRRMHEEALAALVDEERRARTEQRSAATG